MLRSRFVCEAMATINAILVRYDGETSGTATTIDLFIIAKRGCRSWCMSWTPRESPVSSTRRLVSEKKSGNCGPIS